MRDIVFERGIKSVRFLLRNPGSYNFPAKVLIIEAAIFRRITSWGG